VLLNSIENVVQEHHCKWDYFTEAISNTIIPKVSKRLAFVFWMRHREKSSISNPGIQSLRKEAQTSLVKVLSCQFKRSLNTFMSYSMIPKKLTFNA
jgi:hypothetical protein